MPSQSLKRLHWLLLGGIIANAAQATVYPLPPPDTDVIGEVKVIYATKEDTLIDIARNHSLGYDEMVHANPGIDRWAPGEGTPIVLPTRHILPDTPREGVVLNIAEMRLYYYPAASAGGERVVHTYPVSIGRMDWKTPMGLTKVIGKDIDPPWRPPATIKAEHAKEGDILPDVVPGGPDNPLGRFAMRLGVPGYLIHGTNKPYGIGMRVTHGCVRMYPEDVEQLFGLVPVGTPVRLIDQPVKVGRINGELLVESHEPLEEDNLPMKVTLEQAQKAVVAKTGPDMPGVDQAALAAAVEQVSGIPVSISAESGSIPARSTASQPPAAPTADYPTASRTPNPAPSASPNPYNPSGSTASTGPAPGHPTSDRTMPNPSSTPSPRPYTPSGSIQPAGSVSPDYPTASRTPSPYPVPHNDSVPPTAYRPAPAMPPHQAADYEEPPYRPATTPNSPPVDTPAYRSTPSSPPRYARNPGAADYEELPYSYPPTTEPMSPAAVPPAYRPVPPGSPVPYPRPSTSSIRPSTGNASTDPPDPVTANRL